MHEISTSTVRSASLQQRLQVVADSGTLAIWEADLDTGEIVWSTQGYHLLGLPPEDGAKTMSELLARLHPEDRPRALAAISEAVSANVPHRRERFRIVQPDGAVRYVSVYANFVPGSDGRVHRMIALAIDVTDLAEKENRLHEAEERLRTAYAAAKVWTCRLDLENWIITRPLQADDSGTPQFGPEQTFQDWLERVHPEDRARVETGMRRAIETGELWEDEFRLLWPDGRYHWIYDRGRKIQDPGQPPVFAGAAMDIDERKLVEQQLVENEERLRSAYIAGKMWPWEVELTTGQIRRPDNMSIYRGPGDAASIDEWLNFVHPEDRDRVCGALDRAVKGDGFYSCDYRLRWNDDTYHWVSSRGGLIQDARGSWKVMGIGRDFTEEKVTQRALEESERLRLLAIEGAQMGVFFQDILSGEVRWSDRQLELFGVSREQFTGRTDEFRGLVLPEDLQTVDAEYERLTRAHARRFRFEFRIRRPSDGRIRWISAVGEFNYDESGAPISMMGVNSDITDEKESEQQIIQLNRQLQRKVGDFEALMRAMPVAVAVGLDSESKDIRVNPAFAQILGVADEGANLSKSSEHAPALPFRMLRDGVEVPAEDLPQQKAARLKQEVRNQEFELITSDDRRIDMFGHAIPILDESGNVRGTLAAYMDITERKRAEKALRTSEKLATAGKMAASLAHEINNPLAAVTNLLYLVAQDTSLNPHSQKFIALATSELSRVSQITRNILAFYRESHSPVSVDLADLMANVLELYNPKIRESNVDVDFRKDGACTVTAFPGELRQVFSNLIVNAVDAMPDGGKLLIRVRPASNRRSQQVGVRVVIADTGSGISRDHLTHLFEPFFTTKGEKGTGLGLWVSRDIINKHDGTIHIRTSYGAQKNGSCFSIFLPAESASVRRRATQKTASASTNE